MDSALSWAEHSANLRRKKPTGAALIMLMMQLESQSQLRGMGIWVQNSELRIQDLGSRGLGILGALWACHFSHSICLGVWALMALYLYLPHAACHCICLSLKCKKGFEHFPSAIATGISRLQLPLMPAKCLCHLFCDALLTTFKWINSTGVLAPHPAV